jgi:hypothetical protein
MKGAETVVDTFSGENIGTKYMSLPICKYIPEYRDI